MKARWVIAALAGAACSRYTAPAAPTPRDATRVQAPAARTWEAVIDVFANDGIPIRTIERASGLIVTDEMRVGDGAPGMADCGRINREHVYPNFARYNALVRGDSIASSVKVTVVWTHVGERTTVKDCSTTHKFEQAFEESVRTRAEDSSLVTAQGTVPPSRQRPTGGGKPVVGPRPPAGTAHPFALDTANLDFHNARSQQELLANPNFSQAIGDMYRQGLLLEFREVARERLEVELSALAFSTPSLEYQLTRLFLAYSTTLPDATNPVMLLMANGGVAGQYSRDGIQWSAAP